MLLKLLVIAFEEQASLSKIK